MSRFRKAIIPILLIACILLGCSQKALHEAQAVVATADSLRAEGQLYTDSVRLAEAYGTLDKWQVLYPDDYAHACYHYGRLLRSQDNPVAAMQVFINATHSRTHDYHILGRIYSNMGSICHLAGEYDISYDMYERSAEIFLKYGDSTAYFYALNDMAFEMAEKGDKEKAILLLSEITKSCSNNAVLTKTYETRAAACFYVQQYDSAIYYARQLHQFGNTEPTGLILCAQSYSYLGINDSAVFYAKQVLQISLNLFHHNNALYILTEDDKNKDITSVRQTAADRSDVQKLLEIRQGKLSQAVQLLEQDLNRKPDWRGWLVAVLIASFGIISTISLLIWRRRKHVMENRVTSLANTYADDIITSIKQHIDINNLNQTLHWKDYAAMKSDADLYMGGIVSKLETYKLNEVEIRFCILTVLDLKLKQIADTIHYSYPSGIKTLKKRIADKIGTTPPNLKEFIFKMLTNTL